MDTFRYQKVPLGIEGYFRLNSKYPKIPNSNGGYQVFKSRLEKYRRPRFGILTKHYNVKLPDDLAEELERVCIELDMTPSEFIRLLIYEEITALKKERIPEDIERYQELSISTEGYNSVPSSKLGMPKDTRPTPRPKRPIGSGGWSANQWKVNDQLPCPICGTWSAATNFKRDHINKHSPEFSNVVQFLEAHKEEANRMVEERKLELRKISVQNHLK
jgi:hypothetical protein